MAGRDLFLKGAWLCVLIGLPAAVFAQGQANPVPTGPLFVTSDQCLACHNALITPGGQDVSIGSSWQSSMMAHASRDPYWQASVRRETIDHPDAGAQIEDECAACHMPMARYRARAQGQQGAVFAHLPIFPARGPEDLLAADAVSCSMCHQIQEANLGTEASFTAGFIVDTSTPLGERPAFGPFQVDPGRTRVMQSASRLVPAEATHIQQSELCATCHTLYTHARGPQGEVTGQLPEQVPYLEWRHSDYRNESSCQSCHMPQLLEPMEISATQGQERQNFSRHVFRGGNFLLPKIFSRHRTELGISALPQDLALAARETTRHLQEEAARIEIETLERDSDALRVQVNLSNLAGHKLPTAYPSRRAWVHLSVRDRDGRNLFDSGALHPDGSIAGNDNDLDPSRFEPHYDRIDRADQVQIYESIMVDGDDAVTTGLLTAVRFIKDNRILPRGFDKRTAHEDISVQGAAATDANFNGEGDRVRYLVAIGDGEGPFRVRAELWYQPIAFRWVRNLGPYGAPETRTFTSYYDGMADAAAVMLARDEKLLE